MRARFDIGTNFDFLNTKFFKFIIHLFSLIQFWMIWLTRALKEDFEEEARCSITITFLFAKSALYTEFLK